MVDYFTAQRLLLLACAAADRCPYDEGSPAWVSERDHFLLWGAQIVLDAQRWDGPAPDPPATELYGASRS